jgi:hypothetical protein
MAKEPACHAGDIVLLRAEIIGFGSEGPCTSFANSPKVESAGEKRLFSRSVFGATPATGPGADFLRVQVAVHHV